MDKYLNHNTHDLILPPIGIPLYSGFLKTSGEYNCNASHTSEFLQARPSWSRHQKVFMENDNME